MPGTLFPTALDSHTNASPLGLGEVANYRERVLTGGITSSTLSIPIGDTTGWPSKGLAIIGDVEIIGYTSKTSTNLVMPDTSYRGLDGTTAVSHLTGVTAVSAPVATNFNVVASAIEAIETKIGYGASTPTSGVFLKGNGTGTSAWAALTGTEVMSAVHGSGTNDRIPKRSSSSAFTDTALREETDAQGSRFYADSRRWEVALTRTTLASAAEPYGDLVRATYTYYGGANTDSAYTYRGSSGHFITYQGDGTNNVRGTTHGITVHNIQRLAVNESGQSYSNNEGAAIFAESSSDSPSRLWGFDFNTHGPVTTQARLLTGFSNFINNYNASAVSEGAHGAVFTTVPGGGGGWALSGGSTPRSAATTYPLEAMVAITGYSGTTSSTQSTATDGATTALQIGSYAGGWQYQSSNRFSKFTNGITIRDYTSSGLYLLNSLAGSWDLRISGQSTLAVFERIDSSLVSQKTIRFRYDSSNRFLFEWGSDMTFATSGNLLTMTPHTTGAQAGTIGIATSSPDTNYKLHVAGPVYINSGALYVRVNSQTRFSGDGGTGGLGVIWNYSNGGGEVDFWNTYTGSGTAFTWYKMTGASAESKVLQVSSAGNLIVGGDTGSALATNATDGFIHIPSCAGAATGAATAYTGRVAMVYDSTNNKIYVRSGSVWRSTAALT